jgi:cyclopropane-fatty-acyl-phospholipid synthase
MAIDHKVGPIGSQPISLPATAALSRTKHETVAVGLTPLLAQLFNGGPPVQFVFWDGSTTEATSCPGIVVFRSPRALTRLIWAPNELGVARGFIGGDIDIDGNIFPILRALHAWMSDVRQFWPRSLVSELRTAIRLGVIGRPPTPPVEEIRLTGWRHSKLRDAAAIKHHYDVSNDFYRLVLGPSMTYSCAHFERENITLEEAQRSTHDLVCRKLGLHERPNTRLLDVGCGWGSLALHAATSYGAHVVAITLSPSQAEEARERVASAGLGHQVEVRLQDYRDLVGETFDAISSIGMFEHVGSNRMDEYFKLLFGALAPKGRLLNHAISTPGGSKLHGRTFMNRYIFPDGELIDVADVVRAMERAGFEVRDVESLREHYNKTLHAWVDNLEKSWGEAVELVGEGRARTWRLYMVASANGFSEGGLALHQVLGAVPTEEGASGMARTRDGWSRPRDKPFNSKRGQ